MGKEDGKTVCCRFDLAERREAPETEEEPALAATEEADEEVEGDLLSHDDAYHCC